MAPPLAPFAAFQAEVQPRIEAALERLLPAETELPTQLHRAMRYAMFPGGKRLRPVLALLAARVTGGDLDKALTPAAGLECLHTYSLVHDDLPCMDDDQLRRGRPTCHVAFNEATAVLVGDALQCLAFAAVAEGGAAAVRALARAAGSLGMVGGQVADMAGEGRVAAAVTEVQWIHDHKTAALIAAGLEVGALAGGGCLDHLDTLREYGMLVGRAFQIADDCLDLTSTPEQLGKGTRQDQAAAKLTYPAVVGLEGSRAELRRLSGEAVALARRLGRGSAGAEHEQALLADLALTLAARSN